MKETPYELFKDNEKKKPSKNEEAKITIYNALPQKKAKVTVIEEAKDLATLPLKELIKNLKVYEMVLDNDDVASKTTMEKVKYLALKAKVTRDQTSDNSDSEGESDEDIDEEKAEAFNLLARNFRKFFRKGNRFERNNRFDNRANRFGKGRGNSFKDKGGENSKKKHEAIVKTAMNTKTTQLFSWQLTQRRCVLNAIYFWMIGLWIVVALSTCCIWEKPKGQGRQWRRLGHANMRLVQNLASNELVRNLPKLIFERHFCDMYGLESQGNANIRTRKEVSTSRVLELLHLDLIGPSSIQSYGEDDRIDEPIVQDLNGSPSLQVNVLDEGYPKSLKEAKDHPIEKVIGELNERTLRSKSKQA
ncbi:hypothetical protein Tco_0017887 [Tanacetum coccineum]